MARIETWFISNLQHILNIESMYDVNISKNNDGNLIGVKLYNGDQPVQISETIKGVIVLSDDTTIKIDGSSSGNRAYIQLPNSVYNTPGHIIVSIKMGAKTICSCRGNVKTT